MDWKIFATVFGTVFLAELGDKDAWPTDRKVVLITDPEFSDAADYNGYFRNTQKYIEWWNIDDCYPRTDPPRKDHDQGSTQQRPNACSCHPCTILVTKFIASYHSTSYFAATVVTNDFPEGNYRPNIRTGDE